MDVQLHSFLWSALGWRCLAIRPGRFAQGENSGAHLIGPIPGLDALQNRNISCLFRETNYKPFLIWPVRSPVSVHYNSDVPNIYHRVLDDIFF